MKRRIAWFLTLVMFITLVGGAGYAEAEKRIGMLNASVFGEDNTGRALDEHLIQYHSLDVNNSPEEFVYYESMTSLIMALNSGEIFCMSVPKGVADYLGLQNEAYYQREGNITIPEEYTMAVMEENQEIYQLLNDAIKGLVEDGTIEKLVEEHIVQVVAGAEPEKIDLPRFEGATTIKVAVTGDLPPMDYVDASGDAAGFNLAMLAEISQRAGVNIEVVVLENSARHVALVSGKVDAIFWNRLWYCPTTDCEEVEISEAPEGVLCTESYYSDFYVPVALKAVAE